MRNQGPFYLAVIQNPKSLVWYKNSKMGVHMINNMLKTMKQNSPLAISEPNKKITNHSARKTTVKRMRNAGFAKSEVKNITGHSTESGLDPYDSGNEEELYQMSSAISGKKPAPNHMSIVPNNPQIFVPNPSFIPAQSFVSTQSFVPNQSTFSYVQPFVNNPPSFLPKHFYYPIPNKNTFSFGVPWSSSSQHPLDDGNNFYQNCQITINNNSSATAKPTKKRRLAIISDADDSH